MNVIRTNYSTLSEIAQSEAPSAPEYPYTEMMDAYRGVLREQQQHSAEQAKNLERESDPESDEQADGGGGDRNATPRSSNHTRSFQRILKHFFDDYFQEDADEETASDMAQRWVAFARSGDPNYEDSKIDWIPWRYIPKEEKRDDDFEDFLAWDRQDYHEIWGDMEEEGISDGEEQQNGTDTFSWSHDKLGRAYRRRALQALNMEVVEEDELRTELKRAKPTGHDPNNPFFSLKFLSKLGITSKVEPSNNEGLPLHAIRQVQRVAQDMGVLGTGLRSDDRRGEHSYWDDDFFPQLLELKWPPEERLVERDCSCDFWERIRCM